MLNQPYRNVDQMQVNARIHRKGTSATVVKIYFMHLDTGDEKNILESEAEINEWSRQMFALSID